MNTRNLHDKLEKSGLLGGRLTPSARQDWPPWARRHFSHCQRCQLFLTIDSAIATAAYAKRHPDPPPMPPIAEFLGRAARLRTPALKALLPGRRKRSAPQYRDREAQTLELRREGDGVRAFDPGARHLVVFTLTSTGVPDIVLSRWNKAGGVVAFHRTPEGETCTVLAVSSVEILDPEVLLMWLSDVGIDGPSRFLAESAGTGVHAAILRISKPLRPRRL